MSLSSSAALANGRFPAADQILLDPDDASHLLLRATFGLLESRDGGRSWAWICEGAVGYAGSADPALALLRGGNVVAGFFGLLSVSSEQSCAWRTLALDPRYQYPIDATLDGSDPSRAWVLGVSVEGQRQVHLLGVDATGSILEDLPIADGFVPSTLEVAPSRPQRIYVSGLVEPNLSLIFRSDDRGRSWQRFAFDAYGLVPMFISAIDPTDPARLYARINDTPNDHLLVSRDAGETWETVFSSEADLLGFALSPDGSQVAVGGPGEGLFLADASRLEFQPAAAPIRVLRCLRWTSEALYACGQESLDGWTVARSFDTGRTFEALWHQQDLLPLRCDPASSAGAVCPAAWPEIAVSIGADASAAGPQPPEPDPPSETEPPPATEKDGGCALEPPRPWRQWPWWISAAALAGLARRRRRPGARQGTSM